MIQILSSNSNGILYLTLKNDNTFYEGDVEKFFHECFQIAIDGDLHVSVRNLMYTMYWLVQHTSLFNFIFYVLISVNNYAIFYSSRSLMF